MSGYLHKLITILDNFTSFINSFKVLLNTHNLQFLVENHWSNEKILSSDLSDDLDKFLAKNVLTNTTPNLLKYFHLLNEANVDLELESLNQLFLRIKHLNKLWDEEVITKPETFFCEENQELNEFEKNYEKQFSIIEKQNRFMNNKKAYEVDIMSKFVAKLSKMLGLQTVSLKFF
jgi:hypothetical protein